MVDLSYDKEKQTSFVNYKSVRDQNEKYGDVNGGGGKQWLALYQTRDTSAGDPILAPENGENFKVLVQYGSAEEPKTEGYKPLHLFGSPNTPQNLTYADGETGWSYNDGKKGTYVFFHRGTEADIDVVPEKTTEETKTGEPATGDVPATEAPADEKAVSGSSADIGTSTGAGTIALIGALCGVAGIGIGFAVGATRRKRKVRDSE